MRVLLVTDTHGKLELVNDLAARTRADAVLHAGDLGFYDGKSVERLTDRELSLRIRHSKLPKETRGKAFGMSRAEKVDLINREAPLSDLPEYLSGAKKLDVPVYAVWGNHEDIEVVRAFRRGEYRVSNLYVLDETVRYLVGNLRVYGLGGNLLPGKKLFQPPVAGGGGKVWSTLSQYARLVGLVARDDDDREGAGEAAYAASIFVSHVSPGKEPVLRRIAAHLKADLVVSGHMGPPFCMVWNDFAIRTPAQAVEWTAVDVRRLRSIWEAESGSCGRTAEEVELVEAGLELLETLPEETVKHGRGARAPVWYRGSFSINLPDAEHGHAVLVEEDGRISLETYSKGIGPAPGR